MSDPSVPCEPVQEENIDKKRDELLKQLEHLNDTEAIRITKPKQPKKREVSEKAKEALAYGRQLCNIKKKEKMGQKIEDNIRMQQEIDRKVAEAKQQLELKILNKAISIKKRQLKKYVQLDAISDDETPIDEIKKLAEQKALQKIKQELPTPKQEPKRLPTESNPLKPSFIFI